MLKKGLLSGLILILSCLSAFAADETVITTYYPSPYGYYKELKVNRSVTYAPVNSLPGDGKEGELVFFNTDKKFYYYSGGWKTLGGEQDPPSITGTPTWTGRRMCFSCYNYEKGSWTYNFSQPVNIVAIEVHGSADIISGSGGTQVPWYISVESNKSGPDMIIQGNILLAVGSGVWDAHDGRTNYGFGGGNNIGLPRSIIKSNYQGISRLTVKWNISDDLATWCSSFSRAYESEGGPCPVGSYESVTVYYNPA